MSAPAFDPLRALAELERRYDGAIPEPARRLALAGSAGILKTRHAAGQSQFFADLARSQLRAIRLRRADGSFHPALATDLALYRRARRLWRRLQNEAESPPSTVST